MYGRDPLLPIDIALVPKQRTYVEINDYEFNKKDISPKNISAGVK